MNSKTSPEEKLGDIILNVPNKKFNFIKSKTNTDDNYNGITENPEIKIA